MLQFSSIQERLFSEAQKRISGKVTTNLESFLPSIKAKLSAITASYQVYLNFFRNNGYLIFFFFVSLEFCPDFPVYAVVPL